MQRPWVWLFGFETFGRIAAGSAIAMYSHCNACDKDVDEIVKENIEKANIKRTAG